MSAKMGIRGLVAGVFFLLCFGAQAIMVDIFDVGDTGVINGAVFSGTSQHTGGTGNFNPFLSLHDSPVERAYNAGNGNLYMDNTRPHWNSQLHVGDLQAVTVDSVDYYLFVLDANEPGNDNSFISIDNIRIYTSASDTSVGVDEEGEIESLGALRYSMNNPLNVDGSYEIDNWVNLDSRLGSEPAGSGLYDMLAYIPVSAFALASATDYLWFFNLNGVHYESDGDLAAEAGFEEWRALTGPGVHVNQVPDGGITIVLLGISMMGLALFRRQS